MSGGEKGEGLATRRTERDRMKEGRRAIGRVDGVWG